MAIFECIKNTFAPICTNFLSFYVIKNSLNSILKLILLPGLEGLLVRVLVLHGEFGTRTQTWRTRLMNLRLLIMSDSVIQTGQNRYVEC